MRRFIILLIACMFVLSGCGSSGVTKAEYDGLQRQYDELERQYVEVQKEREALQDLLKDSGINWSAGSAEVQLFSSLADNFSEKNFTGLLNGDTIVTVVYAEGRSKTEVTDAFKTPISSYKLMLSASSKITTAILLVMNDNNEVWYGYTFTGGQTFPFVSESFIN